MVRVRLWLPLVKVTDALALLLCSSSSSPERYSVGLTTAVASDEDFLANSDPSPLYQYGYYVHNVHFVMTSAMQAGLASPSISMVHSFFSCMPPALASAPISFWRMRTRLPTRTMLMKRTLSEP